MWSLNSLRDKIQTNAKVAREKALAVAEVAQGVLQVAAEEDDSAFSAPPPNEYDAQNDLPPDTADTQWPPPPPPEHPDPSAAPNPPLDAVSPPPTPPPPPPPPDHYDDDFPPPPPPPGPPPTSRSSVNRSSRYVVTAVNTTPSDDHSSALGQPPVPAFVPTTYAPVAPDPTQVQATPEDSTVLAQQQQFNNLSSAPLETPALAVNPDHEEATPAEDASGWGFEGDDWSVPTGDDSTFAQISATASAPSNNDFITAQPLPTDVNYPEATPETQSQSKKPIVPDQQEPPSPSAFFETANYQEHDTNTQHFSQLHDEPSETQNTPAPWDVEPPESDGPPPTNMDESAGKQQFTNELGFDHVISPTAANDTLPANTQMDSNTLNSQQESVSEAPISDSAHVVNEPSTNVEASEKDLETDRKEGQPLVIDDPFANADDAYDFQAESTLAETNEGGAYTEFTNAFGIIQTEDEPSAIESTDNVAATPETQLVVEDRTLRDLDTANEGKEASENVASTFEVNETEADSKFTEDSNWDTELSFSSEAKDPPTAAESDTRWPSEESNPVEPSYETPITGDAPTEEKPSADTGAVAQAFGFEEKSAEDTGTPAGAFGFEEETPKDVGALEEAFGTEAMTEVENTAQQEDEAWPDLDVSLEKDPQKEASPDPEDVPPADKPEDDTLYTEDAPEPKPETDQPFVDMNTEPDGDTEDAPEPKPETDQTFVDTNTEPEVDPNQYEEVKSEGQNDPAKTEEQQVEGSGAEESTSDWNIFVAKPSSSGQFSDGVNWFSEDADVPETGFGDPFAFGTNDQSSQQAPVNMPEEQHPEKQEAAIEAPSSVIQDGGGSSLSKERSLFPDPFYEQTDESFQNGAAEENLLTESKKDAIPESQHGHDNTNDFDNHASNVNDTVVPAPVRSLQVVNDSSADHQQYENDSYTQVSTNDVLSTANFLQEDDGPGEPVKEDGLPPLKPVLEATHPGYEQLASRLESRTVEYENVVEELKSKTADHENTSEELKSVKEVFAKVTAQLESKATELNSKDEEVRSLKTEKDSFMARSRANEMETENLRSLVEDLRRQLQTKDEEYGNMSSQVNSLAHERDMALEEKLLMERERDLVAERGGDGLREARSVIENLQNDRAFIDARMAAITEDSENFHLQLDRVSAERDQLSVQVDELRSSLGEIQSDSMSKVSQMEQRIKTAESEVDNSKYDREKLAESNDVLKEEVRKLQQEVHDKLSVISRFEVNQTDLEMELQSLTRQQEEERSRTEAFSSLAEEFKDQTRSLVEERNTLYDEKIRVENERSKASTQLNDVNRKLVDVEREVASLKGEKEEWKTTSESLREQIREASRGHDVIAAERDRLLQERASEASVSDREKALAIDCDKKTKAVAVLQKKLTSATSKIEKLTSQRGTFKRQRDDAGIRLRAAGSEFMTLNAKLEEVTESRDELQKQMVSLRSERDAGVSKIQELSEFRSKFEVLEKAASSKDEDIQKLRETLHDEQTKNEKLVEDCSTTQQQLTKLDEDLKEYERQVEVMKREKELLQSRLDSAKGEHDRLNADVKQVRVDKSSVEAKLKEAETARTTDMEKFERELSSAKSELNVEQKTKAILESKNSSLEKDLLEKQSAEEDIHRALSASLSAIKSSSNVETLVSSGALSFDEILNLLESNTDSKAIAQAITKLLGNFRALIDVVKRSRSANEELESRYSQLSSQVQISDGELQQLRHEANESSQLRADLMAANHQIGLTERERDDRLQDIARLQAELQTAHSAEVEFSRQLETAQVTMKREMDDSVQRLTVDKANAEAGVEAMVSKLQSIWSMMERAIGSDQASEIWSDADYNEDAEGDKLGVAALRATASMVAEVGRRRTETTELGSKLSSSDAEVARLIDRAELAESERDALRGKVERAERKADAAHSDGVEEARIQFEGMVSKLQDELSDLKDQAAHAAEKAGRSDKEAGELRALCSKLTSQLNGRTNELDEAEEKLAYLQDQVTTLEEDLQEAHRRLKHEEESSAHSHQTDVDRLRSEIVDKTAQLESIEAECTSLRDRCDSAERRAGDAEMLAKTHRTAEENLQIAIEQLEAAQESAVRQRTIELENQLTDTDTKLKEAEQKAETAQVSQGQLNVRDDEIRELRGAIGRLADERVELKLELEKNLSRLNHPDAGGQLVDRRVVRQLLVSYFRVGSVRRRDVLELMSRMLAFSDADNLAVGLKRRALMDRIGSFVQAPDLDDSTLPPIGTVSDKWIEFLMRETEEGEEQAEKW